MSLTDYSNYNYFKPVANLNAKVKRLVKKTKKVEEKKEYKFYNNSNNLIVINSKKLNYVILNLLEGE